MLLILLYWMFHCRSSSNYILTISFACLPFVSMFFINFFSFSFNFAFIWNYLFGPLFNAPMMDFFPAHNQKMTIKVFLFIITSICMVNISNRQQPHQDKNVSPGHPWVFNEQQWNPHTTGQADATPKTSLYTGTVKELPLYTQVT